MTGRQIGHFIPDFDWLWLPNGQKCQMFNMYQQHDVSDVFTVRSSRPAAREPGSLSFPARIKTFASGRFDYSAYQAYLLTEVIF
jgi:hypothetical protein